MAGSYRSPRPGTRPTPAGAIGLLYRAMQRSAQPSQSSLPDQIVGRYALFREIASGGMASVYLGRLIGAAGFSRVVAIKRLHRHLARDPEFVAGFVDEARLAARIQHPNVVPTLDVVALEDELLIVMEHVQGESLARIARLAREQFQKVPVPVAVAIMVGALHGLHAAHEAKSEDGRPLELVHRDISPQNILVGSDGLPRVVDFGIAKAAGRAQLTASGILKGKLPYMSPEQISFHPIDRRTDVYAAAIVLWEMLAGQRLFKGENDWQVAEEVRRGVSTGPSAHNPEVSPELEAVVLRGCAVRPDHRFGTALEMADALEQVGPCANNRTVARFIEAIAGASLSQRQRMIVDAESIPGGLPAERELLTPSHTATPVHPLVPRSPAEAAGTGTRPGGAFAAGQSGGYPAAELSGPHSGMQRPEEGPGTAATWAGAAAPRRFTVPALGVAAGLAVALALAVVILVVRSVRSDRPEATQTAEPAQPEPATESEPVAEPEQAPEPPPAEPVSEEPPDEPPAPITPKRTGGTSRPATPSVKPEAAHAPPPPQPKCEWVRYIDPADGQPRFKKVCK
jgi:eukaryotic-like serine/threonine-protein kinase